MRRDIQFLRGIAVLLVVLYHSGLGLAPQGFLGVDVFFVISGFLITKMILEGLDKNRFGFKEFYVRRARRLLPALYSTLIMTSLLGIYFLTNTQWIDYLDQLKGALTFSANMVLPLQTGYFDTEAEGKPLLHIWSLSLEEQYYFLLPLFLFILPRSTRLAGLILAFLVSLTWCALWVTSDISDTPILWRLGDVSRYEWAFYLLPTRAWELLAGSIVAWISLNSKPARIPIILKYGSLLSIFMLSILTFSPIHPGPEAFLIVIATSILLFGQDNWLPQSNMVKGVEKVGDWSYSIYLVHWPLFAFSHLAFIGKVPSEVSISLVFASILIGYIQYRFVETPFRKYSSRKKANSWKLIAFTTVLLAMIPVTISSNPRYQNYTFDSIRRANFGFSKECQNSFNSDQALKPACLNSTPINTVVWGDSYAMHVVPGLSLKNDGIAQITKNVCGPFPGVAIVNRNYNMSWAEDCLNFNEKARNFIMSSEKIKHVIMSSPLSYYMSPKARLLTKEGLRMPNAEIILESFENTVREFSDLGKTVIFVSPPPIDGRNIGDCLERRYGPALTFTTDCSIQKQDYLENQKMVIEIMDRIKKHVKVLSLIDIMCNETLCQVEKDGIFLYRDAGHLSVEGSKILFKDIVINELSKL